MKRFLVRLASTMGFLGLLRPAPGTIASAGAVVIAAMFEGNWIGLAALSAATLALGCAIAAPAREALEHKDPKSFVLDEWCGMTIALIAVPYGVWTYAAAFLLFRFFDVFKPLGIRKIDRMEHPCSIMLDDALAGLYANVGVQILVLLVPALAARP